MGRWGQTRASPPQDVLCPVTNNRVIKRPCAHQYQTLSNLNFPDNYWKFAQKMVTKATVTLLAAACPLVLSAPLTGSSSELRLIKTSEQDAGQWVTEQEKFDRFTAKNIGFIDITDVEVGVVQLCHRLSDSVIHIVTRTTKSCLFCLRHPQIPLFLIGLSPTQPGSNMWMKHSRSLQMYLSVVHKVG